MWFIFIIRTKTKLIHKIVEAGNESDAYLLLKNHPALEEYKDSWGVNTWVTSSFQCETEPKEL